MIGFGMYPREQKISLTLLLRIGREENSYVIYGPVYLLESNFFLESELFFDVW
jgi:hypothetical protein